MNNNKFCGEDIFVNDKDVKGPYGFCIFHSEDCEGKKQI